MSKQYEVSQLPQYVNPQDLVRNSLLTATHDVNGQLSLAGSFDPQHLINISQESNSSPYLPYQSCETGAQPGDYEGLLLTPDSALLQMSPTLSMYSKPQPCFPNLVPTVPVISSAPLLDSTLRDSSGSPMAMRKKRSRLSLRCAQCSKGFSQNHTYKYV